MNTVEDLAKIKLFDQVFRSLSLDDVKSILSTDLVVDKLKGEEITTGPILSAIQSISMLQVEIITLRNAHDELKRDFMQALKAIQTLTTPMLPVAPYSQELQTLKSKYSIY